MFQALVREEVPCRVTKHVGMGIDVQAGFLPGLTHDVGEDVGGYDSFGIRSGVSLILCFPAGSAGAGRHAVTMRVSAPKRFPPLGAMMGFCPQGQRIPDAFTLRIRTSCAAKSGS